MAFIAILFSSAVYLAMVVILDGIPRASDFFGHSLGVLGFLLMLMTETLLYFRKRSRRALWGRMSDWLDFHIFTGIVGPYLVLLHTSWKFNGLAGLVTLMTVLIVVSGFIGRYIYTSVPRTADGVEIEARQLEGQISAIEAQLQVGLKSSPELMRFIGGDQPALAASPALLILPRPLLLLQRPMLLLQRPVLGWRQRLSWWGVKRRLHGPARQQIVQLERLVRRQALLRRQLASLAMARRLLALWHTIHIPIGMVLFTAAFIHIIAAVYYATLLR